MFNEIKRLNLEEEKVEKVEKMKTRPRASTDAAHTSSSEINNFIIQLSCDGKPQELTNIKYLLQQVIRWEPLRKRRFFQCYRCQRIGHVSKNCSLPARCVKCGHDVGNCTLIEKINQNVKCVNCGGIGHPASYKGCPYIKHAESMYNKVNI